MAVPDFSIDDIDKWITYLQDTLSFLPQPSHRRASQLETLAKALFVRYSLSGDERDLDASILQHTHTILLPFHSLGGNRQITTMAAVFINLPVLLIFRSQNSKQPSDVKYAIKCLRYLRDQSLQVGAFDITPRTYNKVTAWLVYALRVQMELEHGDAIRGIEEMAVLCRELLSLDVLEQDLNAAVEIFVATTLIYLKDTFGQTSQQVIECLFEANTRLSDSHSISVALPLALVLRFDITKSNDDYECAMGHLDKSIASHFPVGSPSEILGLHLRLAAWLADRRSLYFSSNPEHLEEAISRTRAHLAFVSIEDPQRDEIIRSLVQLVKTRAREFGDTGVPEGHRNDPVVDDLPSFSQLAACLAESNTVNPPSMTVRECLRHLKAISSAGRITDEAEIHKAVQYCRLLRPSLQRSPNQLSDMTLLYSGILLNQAFELTNELEYLNESIDICWTILEARHAQWMHIRVIEQLILFLSTRLRLSNDRNDLDQMIQLFPIISNCTHAKAHERFMVIVYLAHDSRAFQHPSTSAIYKHAISLMSETLVFTPTLEIQHFRLIKLNVMYETLPLDYASYRVQRGQLKEAIETLEQGRGLIWSEMRGFRTSIDQLWVVNSHLAEEFASVNQKLEAVTTSASSSVLMNAVEFDDDEVMGSFSHVLGEHRNVLDERNRLIAQIRALPGFENFLMPSSFDTLHSAAARGPVIIVNYSSWRSDIIILLHNSPPSLIPTAHNFFSRAKGLREQLLTARKKGLDSMEYEDALISVLEALYDLVGRPVIQRLQELNVPEQSRIWWCPTRVFCSLPLHAMGPFFFFWN